MPKKVRTTLEIRVDTWFLGRVAEILDGAERGAKSALSKRLGVSSAHVSNITTDTRGVGERLKRKIAAELGMSYPEAVARAEGRAAPFTEWDPPIGTLLDAIDGRHARPGLLEEIAAHPAWKTSTIARAVMTKYDSPDGMPRQGWRHELENIESGDADRRAGNAKAAVAAARRQRGRKQPLPSADPAR